MRVRARHPKKGLVEEIRGRDARFPMRLIFRVDDYHNSDRISEIVYTSRIERRERKSYREE